MTTKTFIKTLSANDVGATGGHMGGILVPKGDGELLAFLPKLDPSILNPSEWIDCETPEGQVLRLRFVFYNNRMHVPTGTRNEYRITHLTKYLRSENAKEGDAFEISNKGGSNTYRIRVISKRLGFSEEASEYGPVRIKLSSGWRQVH
ncbi:restriction endonuclease [Rhizobium ruizarguesonis]|uniref:EcoRII N-terminal effector-binding domain-containing protein n=1 Tax=Rhizobium ruizarguesonis TaxID=2081791 RepID=UPI0010320F83|nr:EcoRII N-terminal effector-binding domain-containing protein [Rhizobium ruizarguesonis]QIJ39348.1 restriction endonuclease [Rhizobium leguminosarum]NEH32512.1 restriction endonuclease [Rhizobium ruizarguesonis]NEJ10895.1 restriction endonuclease [Rhizobium ruizarguesonis]NEK13158.1 restriction endonuclease [Rhizobium ruizarguesonis]TAT93606.1 restriction endonuclease [Rhizobium ruizarguesonis]